MIILPYPVMILLTLMMTLVIMAIFLPRWRKPSTIPSNSVSISTLERVLMLAETTGT